MIRIDPGELFFGEHLLDDEFARDRGEGQRFEAEHGAPFSMSAAGVTTCRFSMQMP